jgi:hypothetical protein
MVNLLPLAFFSSPWLAKKLLQEKAPLQAEVDTPIPPPPKYKQLETSGLVGIARRKISEIDGK